MLATKVESSKKNFMEAFRSVKSIFSNTQPVTQPQEEPTKFKSIFGGSMGLYQTPATEAETYINNLN